MNEDPTSESALLQLLIRYHRGEYDELADLWRNIDTKAQGVIALAGILLAAFVAFVTKSSVPIYLWDQILSIAAVVLLTASMVASVLALRLREGAASPYHGGAIQETVEDLLKIAERERADRMPDLFREELDLWKEGNTKAYVNVSKKAVFLAWGQTFIAMSILCLAALAVSRILE